MFTTLRAIKYYQIFGVPLIVYIGVFALVFLLGTALVAIINKKRGSRSLIKWHHRMATLCIIFALFHGLLGISGENEAIPLSNREITGSENRSKDLSDIRSGRNIFDVHCSSCHPDGENIVYPDFPIKGSLKLSDFPGFLNFIRNPLLPDGSKGPMPVFSGEQISDDQAKTLYLYLISGEGLDAMKRDRGN